MNSRAKAIAGSTVVKQYSLNDVVTVTAKTSTGYYKIADNEFIHGDYLSTSKVVEKPTPTQSGTSGTTQKEPKPYTGKLTEPEAGVKIISKETIVTIRNQQMPVYQVQTETGIYWYLPAGGDYFRTKEDAIGCTVFVPIWEVLPSTHKEGDISGIRVY